MKFDNGWPHGFDSTCLVMEPIETYFFIRLPDDFNSTPVEANAGATVRLARTFEGGHDSTADWLAVSGTKVGPKWRLSISGHPESNLRLDPPIAIDVAVNGSVLVKAIDTTHGQEVCLWIIVQEPKNSGGEAEQSLAAESR
jgi:hypothetical protein